MNFQLVYTARAFRDIKRLAPATKKRIGETLKRFTADPFKHAEGLMDSELGSYRFRIGDYRVIFDIEGAVIIVLRSSLPGSASASCFDLNHYRSREVG